MIATRSLITVRYGNINCGVSSSGKEELSGGTVDWTLPLSICTWILQFSSLKYPVWWTWLSYRRQKNPVQTRKKNPVNQTRYFKREDCKNQVQKDRKYGLKAAKMWQFLDFLRKFSVKPVFCLYPSMKLNNPYCHNVYLL